MAKKKGHLRIGTSGYQYKHWRGNFYPEKLRKKDWFAHYTGHFDTVEVNNTFYRLPEPETFEQWQEQAPKGFEYALKYSRYGSHMKRLKDPHQSLDTFMDCANRLGQHLGPVLVQLPPRWKANPERLDQFLTEAPSDIRWVVELRDEDWLRDEVFDVLRHHGAALCLHDMLPDHPREITADWTYLRFHGDQYSGSYSGQFLDRQAREINDMLSRGLDVYAFFNNDEDGHAPNNAQELKRRLES